MKKQIKKSNQKLLNQFKKKENHSFENLQNGEKINFNQNKLLQTDQYGFIKSEK